MKGVISSVLILFVVSSINSFTAGDMYMYKQEWHANTGSNIESKINGEVIIVLSIKEVIDCNTIVIDLSEDFIPFDSFSIRAEATNTNGEYFFRFQDGWGNIVDGRLCFNSDNAILFMNCVEFTFLGKQHGRLYGGPFILKRV
jgi:hypothetical protein